MTEERVTEIQTPKSAAARAISLALSRRATVTTDIPSWEREEKWRRVTCYNVEETAGEYIFDFDKTLPCPIPRSLIITETHQCTGDRVWDASVLLARFLEKEIRTLDNKFLKAPLSSSNTSPLRVAEIGAGQGLLSLVVASLFPDKCFMKIIATDLAHVATRMASNAIKNGFNISVSTEENTYEESVNTNSSNNIQFNISELKWGDRQAIQRAIKWLGGYPHLLLASDLAAQVSLMPSCVETLAAFLSHETTLYLATNSQRDSTLPLVEGLREVDGVIIEKVNENEMPITSKWIDVWKVVKA
jgi:hypothetical protein